MTTIFLAVAMVAIHRPADVQLGMHFTLGTRSSPLADQARNPVVQFIQRGVLFWPAPNLKYTLRLIAWAWSGDEAPGIAEETLTLAAVEQLIGSNDAGSDFTAG